MLRFLKGEDCSAVTSPYLDEIQNYRKEGNYKVAQLRNTLQERQDFLAINCIRCEILNFAVQISLISQRIDIIRATDPGLFGPNFYL